MLIQHPKKRDMRHFEKRLIFDAYDVIYNEGNCDGNIPDFVINNVPADGLVVRPP